MKKVFGISFVLLCSFLLFSGPVFPWSGGSGGSTGNQEPPWGNALSVSEDAPGVKLNGMAFIEYINFDIDKKTAEKARVVLRLSKGNDSKGINTHDGNETAGSTLMIFYAEIDGPFDPEFNPGDVQQSIMQAISGQVLTAFFPDKTGLEATLKYVSPSPWTTVESPRYLPNDAIAPGYGTCETVSVCTWYGQPECDTNPSLWIDILSCDGNYEFCGNGIDDDGDHRPDTADYPLLNDPDCVKKVSAYAVTEVVIAVK